MKEVEVIKENARLKKRKRGYAANIRAFENVRQGQAFYAEKRALLQSLRTLNDNIVDSDEVLSDEKMRAMREYYADVLKKVDALNRAINKKVKDLGRNRAEDAAPTKMQKKLMAEADQNDLLADTLGKDIISFNKAIEKGEARTMREIYEDSRTARYVVKPGSVSKIVAGNQSQRIPMTVIDKDGHEYNGFFTVDSNNLDQPSREEAAKKAIAKYGKKASGFLDAGKAVDFYETIASIGGNFGDFIVNSKALSLMDMNLVFKRLDPRGMLNLRGLVRNRQQMNMFLDIMHDIAMNDNTNSLIGSVGVNKRSRDNRRNAAMSSFAKVLGCSEIIAPAENIKINLNGKSLKGTFMKKAPGKDRRNMINDMLFTEVTYGSMENLKLKKQVADLEILDYLCGNPDRHGGNMLYNLVKRDDGTVVLDSIMGIDNDLSFGSGDFEKDIKISAVKLKDMKVITRSMADRIMNLTSDSLRQMLYGYELTTDEIKNVEKRLTDLKEKIHKDNFEFGKGYGKGALIEGRIKVVEDEELKNIAFADLCSGTRQNHFNRINDGLNANKNIDNIENTLRLDYSEGAYDLTVGKFSEINDIYTKMDRDTVMFQGETNLYNVMLEKVKNLKDNMLSYTGMAEKNDLYNEYLEPDRLSAIKEQTREVLEAVNNYITYKDNKQTGEEWRQNPNLNDPNRKPGKTERRYKHAKAACEFLEKQLEAFDKLDEIQNQLNDYVEKKQDLVENNADLSTKSTQYTRELDEKRAENKYQTHKSRSEYQLYELHYEAVNSRTFGNKSEEFLNNLKIDIGLGLAVNSLNPEDRPAFKEKMCKVTGREVKSDDELMQRAVASMLVDYKIKLLKIKRAGKASNEDLIALENLVDVNMSHNDNPVENLLNSDEFKEFYKQKKNEISLMPKKYAPEIGFPDISTVATKAAEFGAVGRKMHPGRKAPQELIKPKEVPLRRVKVNKKVKDKGKKK